MPIYEYLCPECKCRFELRRPFSEADKAAGCPSCGKTANKLLSAFSACSRTGDGESTSIAGMGTSCTTCTATSCASCGHAH